MHNDGPGAIGAALCIDGDIDIFSSAIVRDQIRRAVDDSHGAFTLDLRGVEYMDSVGVGLLAATKRMLSANGRELRVILAPDSSVEKIVEIAGLRAFLNATTLE